MRSGFHSGSLQDAAQAGLMLGLLVLRQRRLMLGWPPCGMHPFLCTRRRMAGLSCSMPRQHPGWPSSSSFCSSKCSSSNTCSGSSSGHGALMAAGQQVSKA